jgi:ABC-type branched-subunit amino acid transport system substrate-binding protein
MHAHPFRLRAHQTPPRRLVDAIPTIKLRKKKAKYNQRQRSVLIIVDETQMAAPMKRPLFFMLLSVLISLFSSMPLLAAPAAQTSDECTPAEGEPIRIGAVFPEGDLFSLDAPEPLQGVQTMIDAINACGGGRPVELVYASANNRQQALEALDDFSGDVPLIIGSGSLAVSEALAEASSDGSFVYWEVTEALDENGEWAFSPRPNNRQLGSLAAQFVLDDLPVLVDGREPKVALLYEQRASNIADGILDVLQPKLQQSYSNTLEDAYDFAIDIRDQEIDVVMVATFEGDANRFWNTLRQADANIAAWVQVGSQLDDDCDSFAGITVSASGAVDEEYRLATGGAIYERYQALYEEAYGERGERADLAASGTYMLLMHILPRDSETPLTADDIREAILDSDIPQYSGLMGEGVLDFETGANSAASAVVQQRQWDGFCSIAPGTLATCTSELQSFPTWRNRAIAASQGVCGIERGGIAFNFSFDDLGDS